MAYLVRSLVTLRREIDTLWPHRSKVSDGWLGDVAHAARPSDHNPDGKGAVHALDITAEGVDTGRIIAAVVAHPSATYVIHNRIKRSRKYRWVPLPYFGVNPHTKHVHISVGYTAAEENSERPWLTGVPQEEEEKMGVAYLAGDYQLRVSADRQLVFGGLPVALAKGGQAVDFLKQTNGAVARFDGRILDLAADGAGHFTIVEEEKDGTQRQHWGEMRNGQPVLVLSGSAY